MADKNVSCQQCFLYQNRQVWVVVGRLDDFRRCTTGGGCHSWSIAVQMRQPLRGKIKGIQQIRPTTMFHMGRHQCRRFQCSRYLNKSGKSSRCSRVVVVISTISNVQCQQTININQSTINQSTTPTYIGYPSMCPLVNLMFGRQRQRQWNATILMLRKERVH